MAFFKSKNRGDYLLVSESTGHIFRVIVRHGSVHPGILQVQAQL